MANRSLVLREGDGKGESVLYIMSRDQRVADNFGLLRAQQYALEHRLPLAVVFCLRAVTGRAKEHYEWMLTGLKGIEKTLNAHNLPFMLLVGNPTEKFAALVHHVRPAAIFFDQHPYAGVQLLKKKLAANATCHVEVVDSHNIVPVWTASDKQEYAARTIRPKISKHLVDYLIEPDTLVRHPFVWPGTVRPIAALQSIVTKFLATLPSNGQTYQFKAGEAAAAHALKYFIEKGLSKYADDRNDPNKHGLSGLSPYLHFGQISSLRAVLDVEVYIKKHPEVRKHADAFIEEIVIRKELSDNFCYYNPWYRSLRGAPEWGLKTLDKHRHDTREHRYTFEQFESAATHDSVWNAAQRELVDTGKMHGYMRMYWAKKVLEWTETPEQAHDFLVRLNDFYSLDGGDPNGYVGILWSIAGLHDRPWFERPIFGTVRFMNAAGLARKFDVQAYERVA